MRPICNVETSQTIFDEVPELVFHLSAFEFFGEGIGKKSEWTVISNPVIYLVP